MSQPQALRSCTIAIRRLRVSKIEPEEYLMNDLANKTCVPCRGGVPPLAGKELEGLARQMPQWKVGEDHLIGREVKFPDFALALAFVNKVGAIAEEQGRHPDIFLTFGEAELKSW